MANTKPAGSKAAAKAKHTKAAGAGAREKDGLLLKKSAGGRPSKVKRGKENTPLRVSSRSDDDNSDDDPRLAKVKELELQLAKANRKLYTFEEEDEDTIVPLIKPEGEPGTLTKGGYNLQEAMGLGGNDRLYNHIRRTMRIWVQAGRFKIGIKDYRLQDKTKLALVFKRCRDDIPYLTQKRFPQDWALNILVRYYLAHLRRVAAGSDDDDDDDGDSPPATPAPKPKKKSKSATANSKSKGSGMNAQQKTRTIIDNPDDVDNTEEPPKKKRKVAKSSTVVDNTVDGSDTPGEGASKAPPKKPKNKKGKAPAKTTHINDASEDDDDDIVAEDLAKIKKERAGKGSKDTDTDFYTDSDDE